MPADTGDNEPNGAHAAARLAEEGRALLQAGDAAAAAEQLSKAAALKADDPELYLSASAAFSELGDHAQALAHIDKAWELRPHHGRTVLARAAPLFALGNLAKAWVAYSVRQQAVGERTFPSAPWNGDLTNGRTLLLTFEQGLGEQIMFASMLPDLINAGVSVIAEVHERLIPLFTRSFPGAEFVPWQKPVHPRTEDPGIDYYSPFGNIGRVLRAELAAFPKHNGCLKADPEKVKTLRAELSEKSNGRPLIGVVWHSGAPHAGSDKSIPFLALKPLLDDARFCFVNLQHGAAAADAEQMPHENLLRLAGTSFEDIDDLAAAVMAVDHVISISTATAHLAGALGKSASVMLPRRPQFQYWYWFPHLETNPWYPSVRTFVQTRRGEWDDVVARVREHLKATGAS